MDDEYLGPWHDEPTVAYALFDAVNCEWVDVPPLEDAR